MNKLYNYVLWYNEFENLWYAIPRDEQLSFFNGNKKNTKNVFSNSDLNLLLKNFVD